MKFKLLLLFFHLFSWIILFSQDKLKIKFGSVTPEDFKPVAYAVDSNAHAVILADIGSTEFEGNSKNAFSLLFKNYRRARILTKNGYDVAEVEIRLYTSGNGEEELEKLKAVTYNLVNGKVEETKLDVRNSVFKDKVSKNWVTRKFTLPNIKEGSIIEYEYQIKSDFIFNLQPWEFQGQYPRLWSEYKVAIPEFYNYVTLSQGYHSYAVKDQKSRRENFNISDGRSTTSSTQSNISALVTDHRWVMKDIPALKEESFTSTLENHISKIEFQLASLKEPFDPRPIMGTWTSVSKELLADEEFGAQLNKDNGWLNDVMKEALRSATKPIDKAKNIYAWMRDNFTCTNHSGSFLKQHLKNVLKDRNGNVAEINLLLVAMLRKAGFDASPVLLSTRSHGYTHAIYPLMGRFNYVAVWVQVDSHGYYLDATDPTLGFGKLGYECYNGHGRIINEEATPIELSSESLKEIKYTSVFMITDEKGRPIGSVQQTPGYYESHKMRTKLKDEGKEKFVKALEKSIGSEVEIKNAKIDSLENYEGPVSISFDFDMKTEESDIIYLNPMFGEGYKENPFKAAERFYPVEMPFTIDEVFNLQLEIPKGYVLDELPKQVVVKLNEEGDAVFEYRISASGNNVVLRSRLTVKRAWFAPEEYVTLREFFNLVVNKHNEQIVFKKKS